MPTKHPRLSVSEAVILSEVARLGQFENLVSFARAVDMDYSLCHRRIIRLEARGLVEVCRPGAPRPLVVRVPGYAPAEVPNG